MADPTRPIGALAEQEIPDGFTRYNLPDGRRVFLSDKLPSEQITTAIGSLIDPKATETMLANPVGQHPIAQGVTDTYQKIAQPVTKGVGRFIAAMGSVPPMGSVQAPTPEHMEGARRLGETVAPHIVPQTPTEALAMAGTGVGGLVPGKGALPGLMRAGARVAGGTLGGATGATLGGDSPAQGAIQGAAGAGAGEVVGKGQELLRRAWTNFTGGLYAKDAARIADSLGTLAPSLGKAKNADELRDLVMSGSGKKKLLDMLEDGYDRVGAKIDRLPQDEPFLIPALGGQVSFTQLRKELRNLFNRGFLRGQETQSPGKLPSEAAADAKAQFFQVMAETKQALERVDPRLAEEFSKVRGEFRVGVNLLELLHKANGASNRLFQGDTGGVKFQTNRLQNYMNANEAKLRQRLGPKEFEALADIVFRGAGPGRSDTEGISLGRVLARQTGPVSGGAFIESFPRLSIPNYTGSPKPFTLSPAEQSLLDIIGQYGAARSPLGGP